MLTRTKQPTDEAIAYQRDDFDCLIKIRSDTSGRMQDNSYDVNGIGKPKMDKNGYRSTAGISTSVSLPVSSGSSAPTISYIMAPKILGAEVNGNFQYFLTDALGTVRDIVDDAGDVIQSYEFSEHGLPMPGSGAGSGTFSPKTYQGALSVNDDRNDSGLYLMGHRHYAAELGGFISRDPIGFRGGLHLYNGHGVSPVTMVDPSGLDTSILVGGTPNGSLTGPMGSTVPTYPVSVYTDGHLIGTYSVTRDPYDAGSATTRYGTNSEIPPGIYRANKVPGMAERIDVENVYGPDSVISGSIGGNSYWRGGIQFHTNVNSEGCMTMAGTYTGKNSSEQSSGDASYNDPYWKMRRSISGDLDSNRVMVFVMSRHAGRGGSSNGNELTCQNNSIYRSFRQSSGVNGPQRSRQALSPIPEVTNALNVIMQALP